MEASAFLTDEDVFRPFPKLSRLSREIVVTEKLDGTNAQVVVYEDGRVRAGSRKRWITPEDDNFGFARWVQQNEEALRQLGPGQHFGEWWGVGIQRGYDIFERRFSLFNVSRWEDPTVRPACCGVVPVLYRGDFDTAKVEAVLTLLSVSGSAAAPGFMRPEGIVVYHLASQQLFKKTLGGDGHKGTS